MTREEEALREMADTRIERGTAWCLVLAFLGFLVLVPLWQAVHVRGAEGGVDPTTLLPNGERFLPAVAELRAFEDDLEEASFLRAALLSPVQELLFRLGAGNEQVYPGRAGWLYYRRDVEHVTGPGFLEPGVLARRRRLGDESSAAPEPDPMVALTDLAEQLARRGVELIVMPIPAKPSVHPEFLGVGFLGAEAPVDRLAFDNPSMDEFERRLAEAGLRSVSIRALFTAADRNEPLYLSTDTHWTPRAMALAANALADEIRPLLPAETGRPERPPERITRSERTVSNLGDTTRMLRLEHPERLFPPENAVIETVSHVGDIGGDEGPARVLFLGDSFANIYSLAGMGWGTEAGLVEQLEFELQEPVEALRINDNGSFATRQALRRSLSQGQDPLAGKRVVVYQFAARELSQGDWKTIELPDPGETPRVSGGEQATRVTGILRAIAPLPRPGSVPYRDAVTSLHLSEVRGQPPLEHGQVVVFRWGMREDAWTSTARLEVGRELTLDVVPWASVAADYGSYSRCELDDEALWNLPTYWAPLGDDEPRVSPPEAKPLDTTPAIAPTASATAPWLRALRELGEGGVHRGADGWLFFGPELRHLGAGPFWGEAALASARANQPELRDPLPAILDFHRQLAQAGIELWLIPVPPKAAIYPETVGLVGLPSGEDALAQEDLRFLSLLEREGVSVIDLYALFRAAKDSGGPLYCRQDTHWSPRACELVAERVAATLGAERFADIPLRTFERTRRTVEIQGDLWRSLQGPELAPESLALGLVLEDGAPVAPWRESPVLLLGDSHTLVFHAGGDLLAQGAGLPDQLAYTLGFPVDVVGVRGSGSTAARISLLRRQDNLAGKRVVLWVFAAREFTQSSDGWREVPVIR